MEDKYMGILMALAMARKRHLESCEKCKELGYVTIKDCAMGMTLQIQILATVDLIAEDQK